jgi:hypothetical protein
MLSSESHKQAKNHIIIHEKLEEKEGRKNEEKKEYTNSLYKTCKKFQWKKHESEKKV